MLSARFPRASASTLDRDDGLQEFNREGSRGTVGSRLQDPAKRAGKIGFEDSAICFFIAESSNPYDLHEPAAVALAVELEKEDALPRAEAQLALADRHRLARRAEQHRHAV